MLLGAREQECLLLRKRQPVMAATRSVIQHRRRLAIPFRQRVGDPANVVKVAVKLQWKTASQALRPPCGVLRSSLSNVTVMSGKSCMNPPAISAIAARPTAGVPSLTLSEPLSAKNAATFSGF